MRLFILLVVLVLAITILGCNQSPDVPAEKYCKTDGDCVAATRCHPTDVVNQENKPDCSAVSCTMECQSGTLDCGEGQIRCVENECRALMG